MYTLGFTGTPSHDCCLRFQRAIGEHDFDVLHGHITQCCQFLSSLHGVLSSLHGVTTGTSESSSRAAVEGEAHGTSIRVERVQDPTE